MFFLCDVVSAIGGLKEVFIATLNDITQHLSQLLVLMFTPKQDKPKCSEEAVPISYYLGWVDRLKCD